MIIRLQKVSMKKFYKNSFIALALVFAASSSFAQETASSLTPERDPFSPTSGGVVSKVKELVSDEFKKGGDTKIDASSPLTSMQINAYKVVGVLVAEKNKVASVKAVNGVSYVVKIGDSLGSEGGKISEITLDGIKVQTENGEHKLPVSNVVEVPTNAGQ